MVYKKITKGTGRKTYKLLRFKEVHIMKFDLKSAVIGLLLGIIVMVAAGAGGGGGSGIGFAVPSGGKAILKASNGDAYIVDVSTGMGEIILVKKQEPGDSRYPNTANGFALTLAN
jgi:hypothetical protein